MQEQLGNQWAKITRLLPGRSDNAVKNRFHMAMRARNREYKEQQCTMQGSAGSVVKLERREPIGSPILLPLPDIYGQQVPCFQSFPSPPPVCSPEIDDGQEMMLQGGSTEGSDTCCSESNPNHLHLARIDPVTNIPYADVQIFPNYLQTTSQFQQQQQQQHAFSHQTLNVEHSYFYPEARVLAINAQDSLPTTTHFDSSQQAMEPCASPLVFDSFGGVGDSTTGTVSPTLFSDDRMHECCEVGRSGSGHCFQNESYMTGVDGNGGGVGGDGMGEYDYECEGGGVGGHEFGGLEIGMFLLEDTEMMMDWAAESESMCEQDASCAEQCLRVPMNWCAGDASREQQHQQQHQQQHPHFHEPAPSALCGITLWRNQQVQQQHQQQYQQDDNFVLAHQQDYRQQYHQQQYAQQQQQQQPSELQLLAPAPKKPATNSWRLLW